MKNQVRLMLVITTLVVSFGLIQGEGHKQAKVNHYNVDDSLAVVKVVNAFISSIDQLSLDGVVSTFDESATAFYPFAFTPERLNNNKEIREAQARGFDWARKFLASAGKSEPFNLGLRPADLKLKMLGSNAAVVTWHSNRPTHWGRRTAVLEKVDGKWLMVHHHASNMQKSD